MSQLNSESEDPLLHRAHECLAATEVPPGPSPRLIERVHSQILERRASASHNGSQWTRRQTYYVSAAVVLIGAIGLAVWSLGLGNRVLADVVKQLEALKSGKGRITRTIDGVEVESTKMIFKGKSLQRMEFSSGDMVVLNLNRGEHTRLMSAEKKVVVEPAYALPEGEDPISWLKRIASEPMVRLPVRTINGVDNALGFARQEADRTESIWVDPTTRLPIRGEAKWRNADGKTVTETFDDIEYNPQLEDSLFEIRLPETYELVDRRPAKTEGTVDIDATDLVLTPNSGLGPIRFGMSREAVVKLLGTPDSTEIRKEVGIESFERLLKNPDLVDSHESIRKDIERLKKTEQYRVGIQLLKYSSKGFQLSLLPSKGVVGIACYTQKHKRFSFRDFQGRTQKGVRMLDSREKIERVYGKPDRVHAVEEYCKLRYSKLGLTMELKNNELTSLTARKGGD